MDKNKKRKKKEGKKEITALRLRVFFFLFSFFVEKGYVVRYRCRDSALYVLGIQEYNFERGIPKSELSTRGDEATRGFVASSRISKISRSRSSRAVRVRKAPRGSTPALAFPLANAVALLVARLLPVHVR